MGFSPNMMPERHAKKHGLQIALVLFGVMIASIVGVSVMLARPLMEPVSSSELSTQESTVVENIVDAMRAEMGNRDGKAYEDAILDAGGELCAGKRGLWCTTFLWWAFDEAGASEAFCGGEPISEPRLQAEWYMENGEYFKTVDDETKPQRGDLYFQLLEPEYRFEGCGDISHGEFVLSYDEASRTVTCISANPVVELHQHSVDGEDFRGYARPDYSKCASK